MFYSLKEILKRNALYNFIYGERSNGKTTAVEMYGLDRYIESGEQMALVRRWSEDFTGKRGHQMFAGIVGLNYVAKKTNGRWTDIFYYSSRWYLCRYEKDGKRVLDENPFCYGFSLSGMEHDKSTSYPNITTIMFDECISRQGYLPEEFVLFMNVCSSIIRQRDNVKIFMLGNSVSKYCPYIKEMGLYKVKEQRQGTIDLYSYGESGLTVAVEYTAPTKSGKKSDKYFAFDNSRLAMITKGGWELDIYPHAPKKWKNSDILFSFFIDFSTDLLQCDVIDGHDSLFVFVHRKTSEIKNLDTDLIFSTDFDPRPNHRRNLLKPVYPVEKRIFNMFREEKIFYQDNEIGEIVRNYIMWCKGQN